MFIVKNRIYKEPEVLQVYNVFKKINYQNERNHKLIDKIINNVQNELEWEYNIKNIQKCLFFK